MGKQEPAAVQGGDGEQSKVPFFGLLFVYLLVVYIYGVGQKNRTCLSIDNSAMVSGRKTCDMSKVSECCKKYMTNLHFEAFKYSLPNLHKYSSPPKFCQI